MSWCGRENRRIFLDQEDDVENTIEGGGKGRG
jgi:hypothetical protein